MKALIHSIEPLESRIAPATFTVTSNADSGAGSLRQALDLASSSMGTDTIHFSLGTNTTILLTSTLSIDSSVIIDGGSQSGYVSTPLVKIDGTNAVQQNGINFVAGSNGSELRGLEVANFDQYGLSIANSNITIAGCTIQGNSIGIYVDGADVTIGGSGATGLNVISGNLQDGIYAIWATNLVVQNAYIGVDRAGTTAMGNGGHGIILTNCTAPTIGGTELNVISGNAGQGIHITNCVDEVLVQNNYIGLYADGTFDAQAKNLSGGVFDSGGGKLFIGTDGTKGRANYISNNAGSGIHVQAGDGNDADTVVIVGNIIGAAPQAMSLVPATNSTGISASGTGVRIGGTGSSANSFTWTTGDALSTDGQTEVRGNYFKDGGDEVIDIFGEGITANDSDESDGVQNFPVLLGATPDGMGSYALYGSLDSTPNTQFNIQIFGFSSSVYTPVGEFTIFTDARGHADISQQVAPLGSYTNVVVTATDTGTLHTSEMSEQAPVAPAFFFSDYMTQSATEGNSGVKFLTFSVQMNAAPSGSVSVVLSAAQSSTATLDGDYSFSPSVLNFSPGTTQQTVTVAFTGDTSVEPTEIINFVLGSVMGNAFVTPGTKVVQITNDDTSLKITTDGKTATWVDEDGDAVTLKSTKGILDTTDFDLEARGPFGGEVLRVLDLSNDGAPAKGVGLTIGAKFDKLNNRGDGAVNVEYINAAGIDLGAVKLDGDLGRIDAGDATLSDGSVKSLTVGSMGVVSGQALVSGFQGKVGKFAVRGDINNSRIINNTSMISSAAGAFGAITIGGNIQGADGYIFASGDIASLKIGGSFNHSDSMSSIGLRSLGKIGAVTVGGSLRGNDSVLIEATTLGKVSIGGDMEGAVILATGKASPANATAALAIAGVSVKGHVVGSFIAAGLSSNSERNPDAQIGAVTIGGDWTDSSIAAGASSGTDLVYGTNDDALYTPTMGYTDSAAILSKIASVTVKGQIYGTGGFVAQTVGKFVRGPVTYALHSTKLPLDLIGLSTSRATFLREVS